MTNHLGKYIEKQRLRQGINRQGLARRLGYKNLNKAARKIERIERDGTGRQAMLSAIVDALALDPLEVQQQIDLDRQEFENWLSEPVPIHMVVRVLAAVYVDKLLPDELQTAEQARSYAREFAVRNGFKVCLILSRRVSVWFETDGKWRETECTPDKPVNVPYAQVKGGGRRFLFSVSNIDDGHFTLKPKVLKQ